MNRLEKITKTLNEEYKNLEIFKEIEKDIKYIWRVKNETVGWNPELENELEYLKMLNRERKIEFLERKREEFEENKDKHFKNLSRIKTNRQAALRKVKNILEEYQIPYELTMKDSQNIKDIDVDLDFCGHYLSCSEYYIPSSIIYNLKQAAPVLYREPVPYVNTDGMCATYNWD